MPDKPYIYTQPIQPGAAVLGPQLPGYQYAQKVTLRLADIATNPNVTEYSFQEAGEVAVFSDVPIGIAYNDRTEVFGPIKNVHLRGRITRLFISRYNLQDGRVVIYYGRPGLGVDVIREHPMMTQPICFGFADIVWGAGVAVSSMATAYTIPGAYYFPQEADYIREVLAFRVENGGTTPRGTISRIEFTSSEGAAVTICRHHWEPPADRVVWEPNQLCKISSSNIVTCTGSIEAVETDLDIVLCVHRM